ncbi:MAG: TolC family protein [Pseudomonadota bacterium]
MKLRHALLLAGVLASPCLVAAPLPQPLTLADALRLAEDEGHYDLQLRTAELEVARAGLRTAQGERDFVLGFEGRLRYVEPPVQNVNQSHNDSAALLVARKRLYDFGRGSALEQAAQAVIEGEKQRLELAREQRKIDVLRAFFDVLLADMGYTVANERMAIVYVDYDKQRDRLELGQISQVEFLRVQTGYEEILRARNEAEARQRTTRLRLAAALGDPTQLPAKLVEPELRSLPERKPPAIDAVLAEGLERNPTLVALRRQLEAATGRVEAARARRLPVLDAVVEGGVYNREYGSNDPFRAGVVLTAPLVTGGAVEGEIARAEAERLRAQATLARAEAELRQRLSELALDIDVLRKAIAGDKVREGYRELYLDRSRALYEMEVSTDLGDSMVQMSDAHLRSMRTLFALSLAWAELDALLGRPVAPLAVATPPEGKS